MLRISPSSSAAERFFCSPPRECLDPDVLVIGSAVGLETARFLVGQAALGLGFAPRVVVADAGPLDLLTHLAHVPGFGRLPFLRDGTERIGGKLSLWGVSAPRPPENHLRRWPFPFEALEHHFAAVERELGVPDRIPLSGLRLEEAVSRRLRDRFPVEIVSPAPLAIDRHGERWTPLRHVPELVGRRGLRLLARFRCTKLVPHNGRVAAVLGRWYDGSSWTLRPRFVVLAVGLEPSLPLLRPLAGCPLPLQASDHIRIDLHGQVRPGSSPLAPAGASPEELGVAVLLLESVSRVGGAPYHLEVKVAPRALWRKGYLPSSDNLSAGAGADDDTLLVQVQVVAAMHDRYPEIDLLNVDGAIHPVLSARDARFHAELIGRLTEVAEALGLENATFCPRPQLQNHHQIGAFRVGGAVTHEFRWAGLENLYVLPPAAYVDDDDDANPTLKSLVLSRYAADSVVRALATSVP